MVSYEWDKESVDLDGDIQDHYFGDDLKDVLAYEPEDGYKGVLVLIRDNHASDGELVERGYAYVKDGKLPDSFDDGYKVPKRFHIALAKD